ncbi:Hypothetical_protein [Hexamita inflata]|uniref:Hypothetical_protein n=1 Tax=Hexamita inflata TaxID=28002 RepID=A0ABP1HQU4_9EUKA
MPIKTPQRPNRALTESLADQFQLIRQLTFKKLVLASQFLFARYFLRFARKVVPLYWHCLMMVAFDASFHQLDQVPGVLLSFHKILKVYTKIKIQVLIHSILIHHQLHDLLNSNNSTSKRNKYILGILLQQQTTERPHPGQKLSWI